MKSILKFLTKFSLIITILILSTILRFWDIQNTPRGLYIDEISIGWNTHLISTTAKDEYGEFLPLAFRAFGEYKLPGYIYATVPVFWLFGPGIWQLRLVSVLAGVLGSLGIYLLTKELLYSSNNSEKLSKANNNIQVNFSLRSKKAIALLSALLFAITPWSIHLSRAAFEANLALTTSLFALYFLLKSRVKTGEKINYIILWFCIFCFVFSFYTYNSARLILPIMFGIVMLIWRKSYKPKHIIVIVSSILVCTAPAVIGFTSGGESVRAQQVLEFGHRRLELGPIMGTLYKYFDHFSAEFLFFKGDPVGRHGVRELGVLLMPLMLFLPVGFYVVTRSILFNNQKTNPGNQTIINKQSSIFLISCLLLAPIPSAIATPSPHALRAIYMLPILIIISSTGIVYLFNKITNSKNQITNKFQITTNKKAKSFKFIISNLFPIYNLLFQISLSGFALFIFCYALLTYQHVYYTHWSPQMWPEWSEHWTKGAQYIAKNYPNTERVVMEESAVTEYYLKFFDAIEGNTVQRDFTGLEHVYTIYQTIPTGAIVGTAGWKDTPPQLTNVYEIIAANQNRDVIYKIGTWQSQNTVNE